MKISEVRQMSDEEILNHLEDMKEAMFNLRFQIASGQLEDTNIPRRNRRDIARLKMVQRERQLAAELARKEGK